MFFGICGTLIGWYGPELLAVFHAKDKKYVKNFIYYGSRRKERTLEILDDVLVVQREEDEETDFIKILDETPFEEAISSAGVNFLNDKEVDKKIEKSLKERYERLKTKVETDAEKSTVDKIRNWIIQRIQNGAIQDEDETDDEEIVWSEK